MAPAHSSGRSSRSSRRGFILGGASLVAASQAARALAATAGSSDAVRKAVLAVDPKVISWYRDIHAHPELGNQEVRTAGLVADHLRKLGFDSVRTGVARTGVVGVLRGGGPGKGVVALRADMDALPVAERTGLPYASKAKGVYRGHETPVMHACGHDAHTAMLMGAAEVLAGMRARVPGTVVCLFQPSEEERPNDEPAGAELMIAEGALKDPRPSAIFGMHVAPLPAGTINYVAGPAMAAQETFVVTLSGKQVHGSTPWQGVDLIPIAGEMVAALGRIAGSRVNMLDGPTVLTVGRIEGGEASNVIPQVVEFEGTMRSLDDANRKAAMAAIVQTCEGIAAAGGATVKVAFKKGYPITFNDPALTAAALPVLRQVAGADRVAPMKPLLGAEDFSYFQQEIPGLYFFLGINKEGARPDEIYANHSDRFQVNERCLKVGVEAHVRLALNHLATGKRG
jgi:amidohydrolase